MPRCERISIRILAVKLKYLRYHSNYKFFHLRFHHEFKFDCLEFGKKRISMVKMFQKWLKQQQPFAQQFHSNFPISLANVYIYHTLY